MTKYQRNLTTEPAARFTPASRAGNTVVTKSEDFYASPQRSGRPVLSSRGFPTPTPVLMFTHAVPWGADLHRGVSLLAAVCLLGALSNAAAAQPTVDIGGVAFIDYSYVINAADAEEEGSNTFDYRRVYVTTDFTLSDQFDGRVRLEAQGRSTSAQGRPVPFIKDAYLTRQDPIGEHSRLRLGVQPPPLFEVAEDTWGYRSLDKTIIDRVGANDSRDFGLRMDVPLAGDGAVRAAGMFANGNGVSPELDFEGGKHLYAQIQAFPNEVLRISAGADYTVLDGEDDTRKGLLKTSVFAGAANEMFHGGVEAFYLRTTFDDPMTSGDPLDGLGVSAFGAVNISDRTSVVGRYDFVDANAGNVGVNEHYGLAAFVYRPDPRVELMPNVVISKLENVDAEVVARFTVHAWF